MRRIVTASSIVVVGIALAIGCGAAETRAQGAAPAQPPAESAKSPPPSPGQLWRDPGAPGVPQIAAPTQASLAPLIKALKPAVVNISTTTVVKNPHGGLRRGEGQGGPEDFFEFFGRPPPGGEMRGQSLGSGFVINPDGFILTNNHVVKDAEEIKVRLSDGREFLAKVIGTDPATDVALVQLEKRPANLPFVVLGDSDALEQGDFVVAIGSPFGFRESATYGIISAKDRQLTGSPFDDFLQTDAAINSGNSGGPLFNMRGEVVGINTAIVAPQIGSGVGFAVPVNLAKQLIPQLQTGKVARGYLGVAVSDLTPELAQGFRVPEGTKGAVLQNVVPNGPGAKAGLLAGDIVVALNGKPVETPAQLTRGVSSVKPGEKAKLTVLRDGKKQDVTVTVARRPDEEALARGQFGVEEDDRAQDGSAQKRGGSEKLGMRVAPLTPELARELGVDGDQGVVVAAVTPGGPAERAGIRRGDVVLELNRKPVTRVEDLVNDVQKLKAGEMALLRVRRGTGAQFLALKVGGEEGQKEGAQKK
jgi:serine protease Do